MGTPTDFRCPNCSSSDVHHRVTAPNPFRCGRCGSEWGAPDKPKESGWLSRTFQWCVKHPKQTAIIIVVLVTISMISVITDPSGEGGVTTGELVFAWLWMIGIIISVAIWLTLKINSRKQQPEDEVTENESADSNPPD
jgi:hypothetical protein